MEKRSRKFCDRSPIEQIPAKKSRFLPPKTDKNDDWGEDDDEDILLASQVCDNLERNYVPQLDIVTNAENEIETSAHNFEYDVRPENKASFRSFSENRISSNPNNEQNSNATGIDPQKWRETVLEKDGEISTLRRQIESLKGQISSGKAEKVRLYESTVMENNEKLKRVTEELQNEKTQKEFMRLENVNLKEKCRLLESSNIKFIEPVSTSGDNFKWPSSSQRLAGLNQKSNSSTKQMVSTKEIALQSSTINKYKLFPLSRLSYPLKEEIDKCVFDKTATENVINFNSNERSQLTGQFNSLTVRKSILGDSSSSVHLNASNSNTKKGFENDAKIDTVYKDLSILMDTCAENLNSEDSVKRSLKIMFTVKEYLLKTLNQLEALHMKFSVKTAKEMDQKYIESTNANSDLLTDKSHFDGTAWFEDEQDIDTRRILRILAPLCKYVKPVANYVLGIKNVESDYRNNFKLSTEYDSERQDTLGDFLDIFLKISKIVVKIRCSHLYCGVFSSMCCVLDSCVNHCDLDIPHEKLYKITKEILMTRPHIRVVGYLLNVLGCIKDKQHLELLCNGCENGNLKLDWNEGMALYNNETCPIQLLCNTIEVWSMNFVDMNHMEALFSITNSFIMLCQCNEDNNVKWETFATQHKCLCSLKLNGCLCICLYRCAFLYNEYYKYIENVYLQKKYNCTIRHGIMVLHFRVIKDVDFISRLEDYDYEEYYHKFISLCNVLSEQLELLDMHKTALSNLKENTLSIIENKLVDNPLAKHIWEKCFENFLTD